MCVFCVHMVMDVSLSVVCLAVNTPSPHSSSLVSLWTAFNYTLVIADGFLMVLYCSFLLHGNNPSGLVLCFICTRLSLLASSSDGSGSQPQLLQGPVWHLDEVKGPEPPLIDLLNRVRVKTVLPESVLVGKRLTNEITEVCRCIQLLKTPQKRKYLCSSTVWLQ